MLYPLKYNEPVEECILYPALTNNPNIRGIRIMANSFIPKSQTICQTDNCFEPCKVRGLCKKHYEQIQRNGQLSEITKRSVRERNNVAFKDDVCIIDLYNIQSEKISETVIDKEDYPLVEKHKWSIQRQGPDYPYARTVINGNHIHLTRLLMGGPPNGWVIDHIDRDTLNNRRSNLRFASKGLNAINSKVRKDNISGYKGVSLDKRSRNWRAYITVDSVQHELGIFPDKKDAYQARQLAEIKYYGWEKR